MNWYSPMVLLKSQSPQIGSMFLTRKLKQQRLRNWLVCRNPLKSGQCFLHRKKRSWTSSERDKVAIPSNRVNVSYSYWWNNGKRDRKNVAIPSNRVNVSYTEKREAEQAVKEIRSQSPQIGSMFLTHIDEIMERGIEKMSQSPQIGSMFLTAPIFSYGL